MTGFKSIDWIKNKLSAFKRTATSIQWKSLTGKRNADLSVLHTTEYEIQEESTTAELIPTTSEGEKELRPLGMDWRSKLRAYRWSLIKGTGALGLIAGITIGGNQYVALNTQEVFHVYVGSAEAGIVSNPQVVDDFKINEYKRMAKEHPNINMVLNTDEVTLKSERAFKAKSKSDDAATLNQLSGMLTSHAVGIEMTVDGKLLGIVKDENTANQILEQVKDKYISSKDKNAGKVAILTAAVPQDLAPGESELEKVEFVQKVQIAPIDIQPDQLDDPQELLKALQTGNVQPNVYTVEKGDCVGCIAKKFGISRQAIYENNPDIVDDKIKEGQKLNLTILQPALSVRTVEKVVENQEVQYETEVIQDNSLRAGVVQTIQQGKNGLKKVAFEVTKVNGQMSDEVMLNEQMVQPPVKAVVKKGTKVVLGEGTGSFAYPVVSSTMTSGFGTRWGKLHKGIDLVSGNKNIMASDNGKVVYSGYRSDYGNCIIIDHKNGYRTLYGHMSQLYVTAGKIVEKGEKIGYMGSTGDSTGVHLHFEVLRNEVVENPLKYLNR